MLLPQGGVHLFQGGEYSPPTGWLDKPLHKSLRFYLFYIRMRLALWRLNAKLRKEGKQLFIEHPSPSYEASPAISNHSVLPATRHR